ncbi:MAG: hypothetical protein H0W55_00505 [Actinobacteria bacterium]|nr:hypothetical protein [Actinomycetota bacterium]MDQ3531538.1 hypothetical protein [Actinomycetota bacterium]
MNEALAVVFMAVVWWAPTFIGLTDLQGRRAVPRVLVWKWTAILCVPVAGALLYRIKGRRELDARVN